MEFHKTLNLPPVESNTGFLLALVKALEWINAVLFAKFKYPFAFVKRGSVAVAAAELAIPLTHSVVLKTTGGAPEALTLADGIEGQLLTIVLAVYGGGNGALTPTTTIGFTKITFTAALQSATLEFVDSTTGWNIIGQVGAPAVT